MKLGYNKQVKMIKSVEVKPGDNIIIDCAPPQVYVKGKILFISRVPGEEHILVKPADLEYGELIRIDKTKQHGYVGAGVLFMHADKIDYGIAQGITSKLAGDYMSINNKGELYRMTEVNGNQFVPVKAGDLIQKRYGKVGEDYFVRYVTKDGTVLLETPDGSGAIINTSDRSQVSSFGLVYENDC